MNGEHAGSAGQTPQDGGLLTSSQSAITAYDRMLQEKERVIRESIAAKYSKIHEVERQLEGLRVALHVNVGPRRQALELLRGKIEAQNHKIDQHRTDYRKYKQLAEQALAAMEREEALKNRMAEELNMLVQQSAGAQLKKLDQLSQELEHLTAGLPFGQAANGAGAASAAGPAPTPAETDGNRGDGAVVAPMTAPAARAEQKQEGQEGAGNAGAEAAVAAGDAALGEQRATAEEQRRRQEEAERRRRRLEEQQRAAADARSRHVQLGGRRPGPSLIPSAPGGPNGSAPGPFRGFE